MTARLSSGRISGASPFGSFNRYGRNHTSYFPALLLPNSLRRYLFEGALALNAHSKPQTKEERNLCPPPAKPSVPWPAPGSTSRASRRLGKGGKKGALKGGHTRFERRHARATGRGMLRFFDWGMWAIWQQSEACDRIELKLRKERICYSG